MSTFFNLIIVIPVGPAVKMEFLIDSIQSIEHFTVSSHKIILLDNSQQEMGIAVKKQYPHIDLLTTKKVSGSWCGLYITLSAAYRYALENYTFTAALKFDTDALVIGKGYDLDALQLFDSMPQVGVAGQYPLNYDGTPWDIEWPRRRILNATRTWKYMRRPIANLLLVKYYDMALKNGYKTGESIFGGAYFLTRPFLEKLLVAGILPDHRMNSLNLGEDHLFSLLAKAMGFEMGDLSSGDLPFACAWRQLPDAPDQILKKGKKVIHSTRRWDDLREEEIRQFFRKQRELQHKLESKETVFQ